MPKYKPHNEEYDYIAYRFAVDFKHDDSFLSYFAIHAGCARLIYNLLVADESDFYKEMGFALNNNYSDYKDQYPFLKEVDALVLNYAYRDFKTAMKKFYDKEAAYPKFHSKRGRQSFTTSIASRGAVNLRYDRQTHLLHVPKLKTDIHIFQHRKIRKGGLLKSATFSRECDGRYFVSLLYEYPKGSTSSAAERHTEKRTIGLDMSLEHFYVDSNGDAADYHRRYRETEALLAKEQRRLSHMKKGSNNYNRQRLKVARLYSKTKNQRNDFLHKLSYTLIHRYDIICIEALNMKAMSQSLHLGKSVHDIGWGEFTGLLDYKASKWGKTVIRVDKYYPSSRTCRHCGNVNHKLKLSDRLYVCPECGFLIDRDWQAAMNIRDEGLRIYQSKTSEQTA